MGLKHKAKKGTVIEVIGVKIAILRGSPLLEIDAPPQCPIKIYPRSELTIGPQEIGQQPMGRRPDSTP
jgi:hypothetical protein